MLRTLFISHGAPSLVIDDIPARDFLISLGHTLPRPKLIVLISAHNIQAQTTVGIAEQWQEWHDFGGFAPELYQLQYRPRGDVAFAQHLARQLANAGEPTATSNDARLDHGAWVPLLLMYPQADIPVVTISLSRTMDNAAHLALGQRLGAILPDDVLLIGSGSITHNLRDAIQNMQLGIDEVEPYAAEFIAAAELAANTYSLTDWEHWQDLLPHASRAHPTPEHFLPLLIARAAAGKTVQAEVLHHSVNFGVLGMDVLQFQAADSAGCAIAK